VVALSAVLQVPRRVKLLPPDSRFFSVHRLLHDGQEDGSSVASGMEVAYEGAQLAAQAMMPNRGCQLHVQQATGSGTSRARTCQSHCWADRHEYTASQKICRLTSQPCKYLLSAVTFRPESTDNCSCQLVVCTEREKFLVPIIAHGAIMALDLPDYIHFPSAPTKLPTRRTFLVRNVGHKAAGFLMRAHAPFLVMPCEGFLEPGEVLQVGAGVVTVHLQLHFQNRCQPSTGRERIGVSSMAGIVQHRCQHHQAQATCIKCTHAMEREPALCNHLWCWCAGAC
jgi:hypothetical protein